MESINSTPPMTAMFRQKSAPNAAKKSPYLSSLSPPKDDMACSLIARNVVERQPASTNSKEK